MKALLLAALVAVVAVVLAAPAGAHVSCTAGTKTVAGVSQRTFCGPARATVHYGAKTWTFTQGNCEKTPYFTINIGTVVLGISSKPKPNYFGITVQKVGGKLTPLAVTFDHGGKGYPVQTDTAKVTLAGGQSKGTFSGTSFPGGTKVTGTFSCG